jgi:starch phosphorylase
MNIESNGEEYVFEIQVYLNDLDPDFVRVELFANGLNGDGPVRQEMTRLRPLEEATSVYVYEGRVSATRPASDYTARIIPNQSGVAVPLEASYIRWQDNSLQPSQSIWARGK